MFKPGQSFYSFNQAQSQPSASSQSQQAHQQAHQQSQQPQSQQPASSSGAPDSERRFFYDQSKKPFSPSNSFLTNSVYDKSYASFATQDSNFDDLKTTSSFKTSSMDSYSYKGFTPFEETFDKPSLNNPSLKYKETEYLKLVNEYRALQKKFTRSKAAPSIVKDDNGRISLEVEVPSRLKTVFQKLITSLNSTERELQETKTRLEALYTAISLSPGKSATKYGQYDEEEMAHRIIARLERLVEENNELKSLLDYGKAQEKDVQIGLLLTENKRLKSQIERYNSVLMAD